MNFTAIDFETAKHNTACAVGIVCVKNGEIVDEYSSLIQPPGNPFNQYTEIHGITAEDTVNAPLFSDIYPEIKKRLRRRTIVAHKEIFDRKVLMNMMKIYGLDYNELELAQKWQCTLKIYQGKGFYPAGLSACCKKMKIKLNHHDALSDARACAQLYMKR